MKNSSRYFAIIAAAGSGQRFEGEIPKQYLMLYDATVIEHTLKSIRSDQRFEKIIVVIAENDQQWQTVNFVNNKVEVVLGGKERCHSVRNALNALQSIAADDDWILVHDAVRPCLSRADL